jgi:hypothetical protein
MKLKFPSKEVAAAGLRHALTFIGGIIVVSGKADAEMINVTVGSVVTAVGLVWSLIEKVTRPQG